MYGIEAIELYVPKSFVDQTQLEQYDHVSGGKYTKGLGLQKLSFAFPFQDVNSMALTVVRNLMANNNIAPTRIGRLEVGTQTLIDKSKSVKTTLMSLFEDNVDIEGATSLNACYGATNALLNALNWLSSPACDGRCAIVVAADLAVYEEGPARPTGGAGAVAMLISNKPKIAFDLTRSSCMAHAYDFYKPIPSSEYPIVDGKLSIETYLKALEKCYFSLCDKKGGYNLMDKSDFFCFHTPYSKMVYKAFSRLWQLQYPQGDSSQMEQAFMSKVNSSLYIPRQVGNIYTGSLYSALVSVLIKQQNVQGKSALLFSYGSGFCSTLMSIKIITNPISPKQAQNITNSLSARVKISPKDFAQIMLKKQLQYGKLKGVLPIRQDLLSQNVYYLQRIDQKFRRYYKLYTSQRRLIKQAIATPHRLQALQQRLVPRPHFHKLSLEQRRAQVLSHHQHSSFKNNITPQCLLESGGLNNQMADTMIENVIGKLSLPLGIIPNLVVNKRKYLVPLSVEEPSVVAACSSIAKLIAPYSFFASSTPNVMIGQVHLPCSQVNEVHRILSMKGDIIKELNHSCESMVERGGGVRDLRVRELKKHKQYVVEILINVCEAMGANITNTVMEKAKEIITKSGIETGIAILSNYCTERMTVSWFEIPVDHMDWKGCPGVEVVEKILQAYDFARSDRHRAATHNKGIMNGIDAVCIATGQDWRAVESAAHCHASRNGEYQPLSHYQVIKRGGKHYLKGKLQLPLAIGTKGGSLEKNPLYRLCHSIMGEPTARELSEVIVSVGLAQNFAALRALAVEGIQKGHMVLHARSLAAKMYVPPELIDECCNYMAQKRKYDSATVSQFMRLLPKL